MGRIVITHSTYLEGLLEKLRIMSDDKNIKTITPGRISKAKGRKESLELKLTTKIRGGFKLIARRGHSVQEVFVITGMDQSSLINVIQKLIK